MRSISTMGYFDNDEKKAYTFAESNSISTSIQTVYHEENGMWYFEDDENKKMFSVDPILLPYIITYKDAIFKDFNDDVPKDEIVKLEHVVDEITLYPNCFLNKTMEKYPDIKEHDNFGYYDVSYKFNNHMAITIVKNCMYKSYQVPEYYILYNYDAEYSQAIVIEKEERDLSFAYNIFLLSSCNKSDGYISAIAEPIVKGSKLYRIMITNEVIGDKEVKYSYSPYNKGYRLTDIDIYKNNLCTELGIVKRIHVSYEKREKQYVANVPHMIGLLTGNNENHLLYVYDVNVDRETIMETIITESQSNRGDTRMIYCSSSFDIMEED